MTPGDEDDLEHGGDEAFAAEYVLGVLSTEERQAATRRVENEPDFARLVESWQARLSPLDEGYDEATPPASVKTALDARLFGAAKQTTRSGVMQSLVFWRGLAAAAIAALLIAIAIPYLQPPAEAPAAQRLVASLMSEESDVRYLVVYDASAGEIGLSHISGERDQGRDFELWAAEADGAPVSIGVIPAGASVQLVVPDAARDVISSTAHVAISVEPEGGSPTGQPTGPVVAVGNLHSI